MGVIKKHTSFSIVINASTETDVDVSIPVNCYIETVEMYANEAGSLDLEILKDTYDNFNGTISSSITGNNPLILNSSIKLSNSTLSGWTRKLLVGDILRFNLSNVSIITRLTINLKVSLT